MDGFLTEPLILSGRQSVEFINSLCSPERDYLRRRDEIFNKMDAEISIQRRGQDMEVDIPDLDLSFIDNESEISSGIKLSMEVSVVMNVGCMESGHFRKADRSCLKTINSDVFTDFGSGAKRELFIDSETGRDMPSAAVKDKTRGDMLEAYRTDQIADAA